MNKKFLGQVVGTIFIAALAVTAVVSMTPTDAEGQSGTGAPNAEASTKAELVEVTQPERRTLTRTLTMPATLLADEQVELLAKTSGYVAEINVDIGSRVKKGDVLAVIDVPEMMDELRQGQAVLEAKKSKVIQAGAMLETAQAEVRRFAAEHDLKKLTTGRKVKLRAQNAIPEQELDEANSELDVAAALEKIAEAKVASGRADLKVAESEVLMAEATVARIKTLMAYARISAPFDGVIIERFVDHGDFVRSAAQGNVGPLLTVAKTDRIRLSLEIPEPDAPFVTIGTPVDITVKTLGEHPFSASISRTALALKASTRTMRAEVDLDNAEGRFAPGMYAKVAITLETKESALLIPSKAIRVRGRELSVLVSKGAVAQKVTIVLGYDDGIWAEVLSGLEGDEWIILKATSAVTPGTAVKTVPVKQGA